MAMKVREIFLHVILVPFDVILGILVILVILVFLAILVFLIILVFLVILVYQRAEREKQLAQVEASTARSRPKSARAARYECSIIFCLSPKKWFQMNKRPKSERAARYGCSLIFSL